MKYSKAEKLKAIRSILSGEHSTRSASVHFGIPRRNLRTWLCRYERYGSQGLDLRQGSYPGDFKEGVIIDMHENHLSLSQTAVKYGIPSDSTVLMWERIYRTEGVVGLYRDNRGRKQMKPTKAKKTKVPLTVEEELSRENELLRAEVAYLKKLRALVEKRVARESGNVPKPSKD